MQSIDIETRWGVPRFGEDKETESYLLEGKPLSDRTYRRAEDIAREPEKRFFPMVEGDFSKIVRKGDSPRNYYWEVTTKDGTVYSYGGYDGRVSDETSLTDESGNRIKWVLHRITDVHGNFAAFHYVKADGNIYPSRYTWTGYGSEDGEYSIEFDIDLSGGERKDVTRSGRLGILQTDRALLRKVTVTNAGRPLRSYHPRYESGPFGKTLLVGIDQLDSDGRSVATQVFDYHNDIENGLFAGPETWTFNNDGVNTGASDKEKLLAYSVEGCDDILTPLGGGSSRGSTSGGGLMVGAGVLGGTVNVGVSYAHAKNESTGKVAFVDIDGDGLPDKVFQLSGSLYYCKNLGADKEVTAFASPVKIEGVRGFSSSVSTSNSIHTNIGVDYSIASAGISYIHTSDQEKTKTYFNDFNGDGLMDIAQNGTVYFNHVTDGRPKFIATSTGTANPIIGRVSGLSDEFRPDYAAERDSLEREHPLSDAVRMWRAPFGGRVRVHSVITKYGSQGDGIIYAIQHEDSGEVYKDSLLQADSKTYDGSYTVKAGDRIFFRLQSRYSGLSDEVGWNPVITYDSIAGGIGSYLGRDLLTYDSRMDFMEGESSTAMAYKAGRFTVRAAGQPLPKNTDTSQSCTSRNMPGNSMQSYSSQASWLSHTAPSCSQPSSPTGKKGTSTVSSGLPKMLETAA